MLRKLYNLTSPGCNARSIMPQIDVSRVRYGIYLTALIVFLEQSIRFAGLRRRVCDLYIIYYYVDYEEMSHYRLHKWRNEGEDKAVFFLCVSRVLSFYISLFLFVSFSSSLTHVTVSLSLSLSFIVLHLCCFPYLFLFLFFSLVLFASHTLSKKTQPFSPAQSDPAHIMY